MAHSTRAGNIMESWKRGLRSSLVELVVVVVVVAVGRVQELLRHQPNLRVHG
jgi:hypothetical protein